MSKINKPSKTNRNKNLSEPPPIRQAAVASGGHVFLSYSREDRTYVTKLAEWLKGHGVKVWFDHDIDYGAKWESEIQHKLDSATVVLLILSKSVRKSTYVPIEVERAKQRKILIFPLLLEQGGVIDCVDDLQFENVIGDKMPGLSLCQKLPGFLVSEKDIVSALTAEQREIAQRIFSAAGGGWRQGAKGHGVAALQTELLRVGLDPGPINGMFGEETAKAVREFQKRRCYLPTADGIVGPITWMILANSSLGDLAPSTPVMQSS